MFRIKLIFVILICAPVIKSSNILVFVPSPWKSHIVSFHPLFLELAHRGHNVTVVSKFTIENPPSNYRQVIPDYEMDFKSITKDVMQKRNKYTFLFEEIYIRNVFGVQITEYYISSPVVQKFIKEDQSTFDLVIVESFFQECTIAIGHKYAAPVISILPVAPWLTPSAPAANPSDFSYIKDFKLSGGVHLDFSNRLLNTLFGLYGLIVQPITYLPLMENIMNTYFQYPGYENRPTMSEMLKNISLSLIDSDVTILSSRPYVPNFIEVPGIHIRPPKEINERLRDFLDGAYTGFVYFNFGTILNVASLPKSYLSVFINVLGRLEQKVVFKWINNDTQGFPNNFYVDSWLPQSEILKHPNCKLFVTHGGIHGLMETIDAGVPLIGFPVFGDQFQNVRISQEKGFGIMSNIFTLSEDTFEKDIKLMMTDTKFFENAKRMSSIFHDRPMSALDKAVYWVEYVIRHKGAPHLRSAAVELWLYQYFSLDILSFFCFVTLLLICVCIFTIKRIIELMFKQEKCKSA